MVSWKQKPTPPNARRCSSKDVCPGRCLIHVYPWTLAVDVNTIAWRATTLSSVVLTKAGGYGEPRHFVAICHFGQPHPGEWPSHTPGKHYSGPSSQKGKAEDHLPSAVCLLLALLTMVLFLYLPHYSACKTARAHCRVSLYCHWH